MTVFGEQGCELYGKQKHSLDFVGEIAAIVIKRLGLVLRKDGSEAFGLLLLFE